ncbi:hypothetical protein F7725_013656 [Dissostichus mawsoni]|uniref:G-protein coupled receptors family 1 profile domain-containing protein n=1 Tax=Dissostichus mawsoni TaxID=36200 RepID=A0A7J5YXW5_DISMA|nr:hypothetical protein F7725_013656 [Dissostichus mawsoni]
MLTESLLAVAELQSLNRSVCAVRAHDAPENKQKAQEQIQKPSSSSATQHTLRLADLAVKKQPKQTVMNNKRKEHDEIELAEMLTELNVTTMLNFTTAPPVGGCPPVGIQLEGLLLPPVLTIDVTLGLLGNAVALWIFCFKVKKWNPNTLFLFNLVIADFLALVSLPLRIHSLLVGHWVFGDAMCRINLFLMFSNRSASIALMTVVAIYRYFKVVHPHHRVNLMTRRQAAFVSLIVWFLFFLPAAILLFCSVRIHSFLRGRQMGNPEKITIVSLGMNFLNSALDPVVYVFSSSTFRRALCGSLPRACAAAGGKRRRTEMLTELNVTTMLNFTTAPPVGGCPPVGIQLEGLLLPPVLTIDVTLGLLGNAVALWIFCFKVKKWNPNTLFLFNLVIADFLALVSLPLRIHALLVGHWVFGDAMCRINLFLMFSNRSASIALMTVVAVYRYFKVVHPHHRVNLMTRRQAAFVSLIVWFLVIGPRFFLPAAILLFCSVRIHSFLRGRQIGNPEKVCDAVCVAIVLVFTLCFLPTTVSTLGLWFITSFRPWDCASFYSFTQITIVSLGISFLNSALDPVVYLNVTTMLNFTTAPPVGGCPPVGIQLEGLLLPPVLTIDVTLGLLVKKWNPNTLFLFNLVIADFLALVSLPLRIHSLLVGHWVFGDAMCRINLFLMFSNRSASIALMTVVAIYRYFKNANVSALSAGGPPSPPVNLMTRRQAAFVSLIVWFLFFLPAAILLFCSVRIHSFLRGRQIGNPEKVRKAMRVCVAIVLVFTLCFLPTTVSTLGLWFITSFRPWDCASFYSFTQITIVRDANGAKRHHDVELHDRAPVGGCPPVGIQLEGLLLPPVLTIDVTLGLLGNAVALWIFCFKVKKWNPNTLFLFNLVIADFLALVSLPLRIHALLVGHWVFGDAMCRINLFLMFSNRSASIALMTVVAVYRYFKVVHPHHRVNLMTRRQAAFVSLIVWFLFFLPAAILLFCSVRIHSFLRGRQIGNPEKITIVSLGISFLNSALDPVSEPLQGEREHGGDPVVFGSCRPENSSQNPAGKPRILASRISSGFYSGCYSLSGLLNVTTMLNFTTAPPVGGCPPVGIQLEGLLLPPVLTIDVILGLLGNAVALWIFCFKVKKWNPNTLFLFNLVIADFLALVSLPLRIHSLLVGHWVFGDAMCRINLFLMFSNRSASIALMTVVAIYRYFKNANVSALSAGGPPSPPGEPHDEASGCIRVSDRLVSGSTASCGDDRSGTRRRPWDCASFYSFTQITIVSLGMNFLNSALDPVVYVFSSSTFRRALCGSLPRSLRCCGGEEEAQFWGHISVNVCTGR